MPFPHNSYRPLYKEVIGDEEGSIKWPGPAFLTQKQVVANTPAPHHWSSDHLAPSTLHPTQEQLPRGPPNTSANPWLDGSGIFSANEELKEFWFFPFAGVYPLPGPQNVEPKMRPVFVQNKEVEKRCIFYSMGEDENNFFMTQN